MTLLIAPPVRTAVAVAPEPPPPEIVKAGVPVKFEPPLTTATLVTEPEDSDASAAAADPPPPENEIVGVEV